LARFRNACTVSITRAWSCQHGAAQAFRPFELVAHHRENVRIRRERLHAGVPGLVRNRVVERGVVEVGVLLHETVREHDVERVRRGHQHLDQQAVGIQGNRREQRVELVLRKRLRCRRGRRPCGDDDGSVAAADCLACVGCAVTIEPPTAATVG
jgi:hypothetical protein